MLRLQSILLPTLIQSETQRRLKAPHQCKPHWPMAILMSASLLVFPSYANNHEMNGHANHEMNEQTDQGANQHAGHAQQNSSLETINLANPPALVENNDTQVRFVCPMHPHIVGEEGDTCPICGMNLEPVEVNQDVSAPISIQVSGDMQQALAIRTAPVKRSNLWRYTSTIGTLQYDQSRIQHIHPRVSGWVEQLNVQAIGDPVTQGQLLYTLYSPELINAQEDYLLAVKTLSQNKNSQNSQELLRKAQLRLELLGISQANINELKRTQKSLYRVPFYAESAGVVNNLNIRDGMYITPQTELMSIVDLSQMWLETEIFEGAQAWLALEQTAEVNIPAQQLYQLQGKVDYIYPELDPQTRSLKVRITLENPNQQLKANSFAEVGIFGGTLRNQLTIPLEALIQTGDKNRVVIQNPDQSFSVRPVTLGLVSQDKVQVLEGLHDGELVVVSGQFMLDSEASLKGSLQRLQGAPMSGGHQH